MGTQSPSAPRPAAARHRQTPTRSCRRCGIHSAHWHPRAHEPPRHHSAKRRPSRPITAQWHSTASLEPSKQHGTPTRRCLAPRPTRPASAHYDSDAADVRVRTATPPPSQPALPAKLNKTNSNPRRVSISSGRTIIISRRPILNRSNNRNRTHPHPEHHPKPTPTRPATRRPLHRPNNDKPRKRTRPRTWPSGGTRTRPRPSPSRRSRRRRAPPREQQPSV